MLDRLKSCAGIRTSGFKKTLYQSYSLQGTLLVDSGSLQTKVTNITPIHKVFQDESFSSTTELAHALRTSIVLFLIIHFSAQFL